MLQDFKSCRSTIESMAGEGKMFESLYNPIRLMEQYEQQRPNNAVGEYLRRVETSERTLMQDILLMLLGLESGTFRFKPDDGFSIAGIVEVSHLTPLALENMVSTFTQFANKIKYIENKLEVLARRPSLILSNLNFSVKDWLRQLKELFSQVLSIVGFQSGRADRSHLKLTHPKLDPCRPMTLLVLREILAGQSDIMSIVLGLIKRCLMNDFNQENNNYSAHILNTFWELIDKLEHEFIHTSKAKTLLSMLEKPLTRYLEFMRGWLSGQDINDPYNEFYIQFTPNSNNTSQVEQYAIRRARSTMVPTFLKDVAGEVFLTGRFIRTLYCFVKETDRQRISEQLDIDGRFRRLQEVVKGFAVDNSPKQYQGFFRKMKKVTISGKLEVTHTNVERSYIGNGLQQLPYGMEAETNNAFMLCQLPIPPMEEPPSHIISSAGNFPPRKFISDYAIQFELALTQTLLEIKSKCEKYFCFIGSPVLEFSAVRQKVEIQTEIIKRFLLAGQGDFIQQLLENIGEELDKSVALISSNVLKTGIDNAIKNSNAHYLQEEIIKAIGWRFIVNDSGYTGWEVFSLDCRVQYPLCLVFPQSMMDRYSVIFNFLWKLKRIEAVVKRLWMDNYGLNRMGRIRRIPQKYYGFRSAANHFTTTVLSEILLKIDIEWNRFMEQKNRIQNFYEFLTLHNDFLTKLEQITFISLKDKSIIARLGAITQVILRFRNLNLYVENEEYEQLLSRQKYQEMLRLQVEFNALMREFVKIDSGLASEAIDLNGFYDRP